MAAEYRQRPGVGDHFDDEDLVMSSAQQRRNWRGILIALMVIVAVLAMIVTSVVLLTPPQPEELLDSYSDLINGDRAGSDYYYNQRANDELWWRRRGMRTLRLSDVLTDSARIKTFNGTWISGNEMFYVTGYGDLAVMEVGEDGTTRTTRHLVSKIILQKLNGPLVSFELSPDRNHVLIGHDAKKLFRYSKTARYTVYTVSTGQMTPVTLDDRRHRNGTTTTTTTTVQQPYLLHAQWHEISTTVEKKTATMALIVVYRYDVYYVPWSSKLTADTDKRNVTAVTRTAETAKISRAPSSATPSAVDDENGKEPDNNATVPPKLSWEPWPHGLARRITTSGSGASASDVGEVSNGVADYLYEMEILKRSPAVWPSSGRYLMYATFDDRRVGEYKYPVYMKGGRQRDRDTGKHARQQKQQRKKRRRRRNSKLDATANTREHDTSEYYLYPEIRTIRYPKVGNEFEIQSRSKSSMRTRRSLLTVRLDVLSIQANTPNPVVTLSVIVNLDQLGNPQVQPKIRTLTPPPTFQYTDDYYFTAVQWVNDGGGVGGNHEIGDDKSAGTSAAEVCVVWLNRAQNTSVTTLCKSPMWMCQETQVINAVGAGSGGSVGGGIDTSSARLRYRRNRGNPQSPPVYRTADKNAWTSDREDGRRRRRRSRSRRRRAGDVNDGGAGGPRGRYGGWVDATVGGAGGGVPSTGGSDASAPFPGAAWWSNGGSAGVDDGENFAGDDGYAGVSGTGDAATGAGYAVAALVRRGWETGDRELTPRAPVFATDGQGYVSVAPVRDEQLDGGEDGARLRRPASKPHAPQDRNANGRPSSRVGEYYAQVVAVNITKKLLASVTYGEFDDDDDDGGGGGTSENGKRRRATTKSWTVVRILAWDQRANMIYFLAIPSGRGAPNHRHLYAVKFTNAASSSVPSADPTRANHNHQQQYRKPVRHHSRPVCLSCDMRSNNVAADKAERREPRDVGGKQNRMDEARDGRLRQQQRERWEHQKDNEAATAEEAERRQQRNRRQHHRKNIQSRGTTRHCTYYDAQFSRDGTHYALTCLGPSVPYVTLHRTVADDNDNIGVRVDTDDAQNTVQKRPNDSSYSFEFVALLENNTRLQDKYTNRVLLPGTRTFQLRLSGGRKLTTSGGLHFNDPLSAANYYSNGGSDQSHFSAIKRPDPDPLTVAQVRLYLPLGIYDPEADPRPEFMLNREINSDGSTGKVDDTISEATPPGNILSTNDHRRRRRSLSSSSSSSRNNNDDDDDDSADGTKRQRRPHKLQRRRRFKKLYPMLVVINSDPGSQAITDRFSDRLGYTTGLLCSGSLGRTIPGVGGVMASRARYGANERDRRNHRGRRSRRSSATRYYSSGHDDVSDNPYDFYRDDNEDANNNEYVVAVIDPGQGTWGRGYESLLALNYGDGNDVYSDNNTEDYIKSSGLLGTADLRDQMEAVEYLLSSASTTGDDFKDSGQGYYSEDRPKGSHGGRSRWSSSSQTNRRYYSDDDDDDDDDYYDENEEYDDNNDKNDNDDYYYYYYSNGEENSDYDDDRRGDDFHRDGDSKKSRRERRGTSDTKENVEALRLPYVDSTKVALLGGGPISPSTQPSIYSGYATARMAMWQAFYGGSPIEKRTNEEGNDENRKEPVAIHSSFKCAITISPIFSWRLYASAFAERYYGYFGGTDGDTWLSYDRSDLIPFNESSFLPASHGKGINLLVIHGTADTTIHPQNSMMFVRDIMHQQQQQYSTSHNSGGSGRHNSNSSGGRVASGFPTRSGAIGISQLVMPDVDLSYSRMATGIENDSPIDHHYQMIHSLYGHISRYLATECFTDVGDGSRSRGIKVRGRRLRKRRRRWRTGNRGQDTLDDKKQQQREEHSGEHGRYRRNDIDNSQQIMDSKVKNDSVVIKTMTNDRNFSNDSRSNNIDWGSNFISDLSSLNNNNISSIRKRNKENENDTENDSDEDSDEEYDDKEDSSEEYEGDGEKNDDK